MIIASEELPAGLRGTGITILTGVRDVGTVAMAKTSPFFLLLANADGNPAHDFAMQCVAARVELVRHRERRRALARAVSDRRVPAVPAAVPRDRRARDARYREIAAGRDRVSIARHDRRAVPRGERLIEPQYLPRFRIVVLLWNCVYLVIAPAVAFWSIYAREEVGMTPAQVGNVVMWAYIAGTFGHLLAGQLVDRIGRKVTCAAFYSIAAVAIIGLFHTQHGVRAVLLAHRHGVLLQLRDRRNARVCVRTVPDRIARHRLRLDDESVRPRHRSGDPVSDRRN